MDLHLIRDYKTKKNGLSGQKLTDSYICACIGDERAEILREEEGKPYVVGGPEFSVSHSGDLLAIAVAGSGEGKIGIDLQYKRDIDIYKLAERFFTDREVEFIRGSGLASDGAAREDAELDAFYLIWTRKEAYAKYTGRGLGQVMDRTEVLDREDVVFKDIAVEGAYACALCLDASCAHDLRCETVRY